METARELKQIENEINSLERRLTKLRQAGSSTHNVLSATHADSLAGNVVRGDVIVGNSTPRWSRLGIGNNGDVLTVSGSDPVWSPPGGGGSGITVQNRVNTTTSVVNTIVETNIYNYTVPGGTLGTTGMLRLTLFGYLLNNSGGSRWHRIRIYYGATLLYDDTSATVTAHATRYTPFWYFVTLMAANATNSQKLMGTLVMGSNSGANTGHGAYNTDEVRANTPIYGVVGALDSTVNQALRVTIQHQAAHASLGFYCEGALLEKI